MKQYLLVFLLAVTSQLMVAQTKDLAITNWYAPKTKGSLTDSESVRFGLINNGTEVVTSFTVGFSQDGGQTFKEEVVTKTINANGGQYTYTFLNNFAQVGTDGASYTLIGRVVLEGDEVTTNNEITVTIENRIVGDMGDEPIQITAFPFTDSKEYALYHDDYMAGFTASNYMQEEDVVYAFATTEAQMYVDAKVHANWSVPGPYPKPSVHLINKSPDVSFTNLAYGIGDFDAELKNGYCGLAQTYYLVVSKWTTYSFPYDLEVKLYRQHDFKSFGFDDLSVQGDIDYSNRTITLTVPQGTDKTALVPAFELPAYTKVWVNGIEQTSGITGVDFTGDVTYSVEQTINPKTTQTWTISVVEDAATSLDEEVLAGIALAPNPAEDVIQVTGIDPIEVKQITIYSSSGSVVYNTESVKQSELTISVSNLNAGIYFVTIKTDSSSSVKKVVKK